MGLFSSLKNLVTKEDLQQEYELRECRILVDQIEGVSFSLKENENEIPIKIDNISINGIGLSKDSVDNWGEVGSSLFGKLHFDQKDYDVQMEIARITPSLIGCKFTEFPTEYEEHFEEFFAVELAATDLVPITMQGLSQESEEGKPFYYKGDNDCLIKLLEKDKNVISFSISFLGHNVGFEVNKPLKAWFEDNEEGEETGSNFVQIIKTTRSFLNNTSCLPKEQRAFILEQLNSGPAT